MREFIGSFLYEMRKFMFNPDYVFYMARFSSDEHVLRAYAQHPDARVRLAVVRNVSCPLDTVDALTNDADDMVRIVSKVRMDDAVAVFAGFRSQGLEDGELSAALGFTEQQMPAFSYTVFETHEHTVEDCYYAISDPNCEWWVLEIIAEHSDDSVRESVLDHPSLPLRAVVKLAHNDTNPAVRFKAGLLMSESVDYSLTWSALVDDRLAHIYQTPLYA